MMAFAIVAAGLAAAALWLALRRKVAPPLVSAADAEDVAEACAGMVLSARYRLEEKIGEGGFGAVFRASDARQGGRTVAVKIFRPNADNRSSVALERFRLEAVSAGKISHPNAVGIYDSGVSCGIAYLVMEYVPGRSLATELSGGARVPPARALRLTAEICDALAHAHRSNIVHRDIKPENVLITPGDVAKVIDFGVAKIQEATGTGLTLTMTGAVVGTPTYIAPERLENVPYDGRSDVYSVGILLYEMLCGRPPFMAADGNVFSLVMMHLQEPPPPLTDFTAGVPATVQALVLLALEKNPADRPTAEAFAAQLRALALTLT
jgi:serine/threonine protein kinase